MRHPIYRVTSVEVIGPYRLKVGFDDETVQDVDLAPILHGEMFGPLRDRSLFEQVQIDGEVATLVWPNGADFDPATLHDWPEHVEELKRLGETGRQRYRQVVKLRKEQDDARTDH